MIISVLLRSAKRDNVLDWMKMRTAIPTQTVARVSTVEHQSTGHSDRFAQVRKALSSSAPQTSNVRTICFAGSHHPQTA